MNKGLSSDVVDIDGVATWGDIIERDGRFHLEMWRHEERGGFHEPFFKASGSLAYVKSRAKKQGVKVWK